MKKRILSILLALSLLLSLCGTFSFGTRAASNYSKVRSLSVGSKVVFLCETAGMELSSISTTSTKYGVGLAYTTEPGGLLLLEVCAGYKSGTFAFMNNGKYLYWGSGNSLNMNATLNANTSWTVSFDASGNATIVNSADTARQLWWNNSSPRFACYTGKSANVGGYYSIQIYKAGANACTHESTNYTVTTAPTCEEKGVGKYICTACGYSWTVTIAALGHNYHFALVNGSVYRSCEGCGDAQAVTMNTIAEAKAYTDKSTEYNLRGIVTYLKGRTAYIESDGQGLCVYFDISVDTSGLSLGDEIFVSSTMTTFKNLPELDCPTQFLVLSKGNSLPETKGLTIGQILADAEFYYVGKRVTLEDVTIGTVNTSGYTGLTDKNGDSISIYALPEAPADVQAGNVVDVTAIISYYDDGFQLLVNPSTVSTDVVKVGDGTAVEIRTVTIAEAKAGQEESYYQVEGIVTCMQGRQIFIQDETGGIVVYLSTLPTDAPCAVGDLIRVYGSFGNYDGVLELQYVDHTDPKFFSILSSGHAVVAQPVTIDELLRDSAIEYEYFAEKVFLNDVSILEIADNGSVLLWQDDSTIEIYSAPVLNEGCDVGAVVDVTATVSGYEFNYELVIVDANAVTYGSECQHTETVAVDLLPPTCTEEGYSGDVYCTVCGTFLSAGHSIPAAHTVGYVNGIPAGCETDGYMGDMFCEICQAELGQGEIIPALGHDYVAGMETAASCTDYGFTLYVCSLCGNGYEGDIVPAFGHDCEYLENGDFHSYLCHICGAVGEEEHSYVDGFCSLCGAVAPEENVPVDESIVIRHTLNLASDISINFAVSAASLTGYDGFYLECLLNSYSGNLVSGQESIVIDEPTLNGSYYYFTLTGINATQMNNEIEAVLYMTKGEELYMSHTDIYSVATYAYTQLDKATASESLKTLCADLLRYGAAAQTYKAYRTNALADANMTEVHKSYLSDADAVVFGNNSAQLGDLDGAKITWVGKSLIMDSKVTLRFIFDTTAYTGGTENLSLHVSYKNYQGEICEVVVERPIVYNADKNWYAFDFDSLLAAELRSVLSVAVYEGSTRVSETLRYSADTYGNNKTGKLLTVCKTMIAYSDSALAYFTA